MTDLIVNTVAALALAGAGAFLGIVIWQALHPAPPTSEYPERRRVVVNMIDDPTTSIRGVLWEKTSEYLVIKGAEVCRSGQKPIAIDGGEALIFRANVAWLQILGGES